MTTRIYLAIGDKFKRLYKKVWKLIEGTSIYIYIYIYMEENNGKESDSMEKNLAYDRSINKSAFIFKKYHAITRYHLLKVLIMV